MTATETQPKLQQTPVIGRRVMVQDLKHKGVYVEAIVIDKQFGTNLAKKVRITTGEHVQDVLQRSEFIVAEFLD